MMMSNYLTPNTIISGDPPDCHPVIFESIDAASIRSTSLNTHGAAGPSGMDAYACLEETVYVVQVFQ